ncbi:membrane anchored protein in chemotaxis locus [Shewanella maritima]|uniref:membrane anchored protein in chemotaxis locus n=1 Tax=Shewanella maritima TaxID=2520507 RepID=UPI003735ED0E
MAKPMRMRPWQQACMLLLVVASVTSVSLYFDAVKKIELLEFQVSELEKSQVLLMVPEDQAQALATWLDSHPEQTQAIFDMASQTPNQAVTVEQQSVPPKAETEATSNLEGNSQKEQKGANQLQVVSENEDGVKVIRLPHGGIRVTTREQQQNNNQG